MRIAWALSAGTAMTQKNVHAQPQRRLFRIGQLGLGSPESSTAILQATDEGYREIGLVEGRNVEVVQRWARGSLEALPALAAELVALPVDVIVAGPNPSIAAAQGATSTLPIVMVLGVDPVRNGFVESLARPGKNITGLTNEPGQSMNGKMLELLKQLVPAASVIGVLLQQGVGIDRVALEEAGRELKLELRHAREVRRLEDVGPALEALKSGGARALLVIGGTLIYQSRKTVADLALQHRLPTIFFSSDYALWTPRWLIESFVDFNIPDELGEYPKITTEQKKKILGLNAARLYDIKVPGELEAEKEQTTEAVGVPSP